MQDQLNFYIDGAWVPPVRPATRDVVNPATEKPIAKISMGSAADVDKAVTAARRAFESYSKTTREERIAMLQKIVAVYQSKYEEMAKTISSEMGAPIWLSKAAQAAMFVAHFNQAIEVLKTFEFEEKRGKTQIIREPVGVCGLITPWNWPINQIACKVAPALAAGCTIVIKPASFTPAATYELVRLINQTGLPRGVLNLVPGPGSVVGSEIIANKKVDKISFTGETGTGKRIGAQAGMEVKRVSLELGGKAPYVIFDDADVEAASRAAIFGMFRNAGQACGATTRLLVHEGIHRRFLDRVIELTRTIEVGHPSKPTTDMGPLISRNQEKVVQEYIQYGVDQGFRLVTGGHKLTGEDWDNGYYVEPTIFDGVDNASRLGQEEIFGPVVAVTTFRDEAEAIELANAVDFGLVAGVWSADYPRAMRVARRIRAGTVWIWDNYAQPVEGIWGGYKQSGMGRELGYHGLNDFLEIKQIFTDGTGLAMKPPYGQVIKG